MNTATAASTQNTFAKDLKLNTRYVTASEFDDATANGYEFEYYVFTERGTTKSGTPTITGKFFPQTAANTPGQPQPVRFLIIENYWEKSPSVDFFAAHAEFVELTA